MDMKKSPLSYDADTQRRGTAGGQTFACTSNAIRDCCGGPSNYRPQKSATLNYRQVSLLKLLIFFFIYCVIDFFAVRCSLLETSASMQKHLLTTYCKHVKKTVTVTTVGVTKILKVSGKKLPASKVQYIRYFVINNNCKI